MIIHLDLDAFYCAVEEQRDPSLRGRPFAVGGRPESRGVVASCSYPARRRGVRSAMPMSQAVRICPGLIIVEQRHGVYSAASRKVMAALHELTSQVEQISIDEAFLDVSGIPGQPEVIARTLQARIRDEFGLPCSLGLASNKLVAKIANDFGKSSAAGDGPPSALTIVPPGEEASFLAPLPVERLWGVGPKTAEKLAEMDIETIGDLARMPVGELKKRFGKNGEDMARRARGVDHRPIVTERQTKSISSEVTFARDIWDEAELRRTLDQLSDEVAGRLHKKDLHARTIKLKLRWADFTTISRQITLSQPTDRAHLIIQAASQLFSAAWQPRPGAKRPPAVRLLGVGVSGLENCPRQLELWEGDRFDD